MNEDKLDHLLREIYDEPIYPPLILVENTKSLIKGPGLLEFVVALSMFMNLLTTFVFSVMIIWMLEGFFEKIILYISISFIQNAIVLIAYLYKDDIKEIFKNFSTEKI